MISIIPQILQLHSQSKENYCIFKMNVYWKNLWNTKLLTKGFLLSTKSENLFAIYNPLCLSHEIPTKQIEVCDCNLTKCANSSVRPCISKLSFYRKWNLKVNNYENKFNLFSQIKCIKNHF